MLQVHNKQSTDKNIYIIHIDILVLQMCHILKSIGEEKEDFYSSLHYGKEKIFQIEIIK